MKDLHMSMTNENLYENLRDLKLKVKVRRTHIG